MAQKPQSLTFTSQALRAGVWEGSLKAAEPPGRVALVLNGVTVARAEILPERPGEWQIRVALPADTLTGGTQTYLLIADDGNGTEGPQPGAVRLGSLPMLAGEALDSDLRAEIDLLRAEIDLIKREFRRLATE